MLTQSPSAPFGWALTSLTCLSEGWREILTVLQQIKARTNPPRNVNPLLCLCVHSSKYSPALFPSDISFLFINTSLSSRLFAKVTAPKLIWFRQNLTHFTYYFVFLIFYKICLFYQNLSGTLSLQLTNPCWWDFDFSVRNCFYERQKWKAAVEEFHKSHLVNVIKSEATMFLGVGPNSRISFCKFLSGS